MNVNTVTRTDYPEYIWCGKNNIRKTFWRAINRIYSIDEREVRIEADNKKNENGINKKIEWVLSRELNYSLYQRKLFS